MRRYIQTFFRHRLLLCAPLVIALVASVAYGTHQPRKYVSQGTLWADAPIPNDSTIFSAPNPSVAAAQSAVLVELLHTQDFLVKVGRRSPWAGFLASHSQTVDNAFLGGLPKKVGVSTPGPQIIGVTVTSSDPQSAAGLAKAVMDEFVAEVVSTRQTRGRALQDYYKLRVDADAKTLSEAQSQLGQYLQGHPKNSAAASDPTASQLAGAVSLAQKTYDDAKDSYSTAGLDTSQVSDTSQLHIVDQPSFPTAPQSRKKQLVFVSAGGLLAGAVISLIPLLLMVAADTSPRQAADIEDELGLQVVGTIEQFRTGRRRRGAS